MQQTKVFLLACLIMAVLSSAWARPHGSATNQELLDIAYEWSDTLNEVVAMLNTERRPSRRRRMVQFHIGRHHHHPRSRYRRNRRMRYRNQRGGRNADISDH